MFFLFPVVKALDYVVVVISESYWIGGGASLCININYKFVFKFATVGSCSRAVGITGCDVNIGVLYQATLTAKSRLTSFNIVLNSKNFRQRNLPIQQYQVCR